MTENNVNIKYINEMKLNNMANKSCNLATQLDHFYHLSSSSQN